MQKFDCYEIYKLQDGGYCVRGGTSIETSQMYRPFIFASAKISECLEYIREKLEPKP